MQIGYAINLITQREGTQIERQLATITTEMRDLAKSTEDNSNLITLITLLSAVYIPGSFVAVRLLLSTWMET